MTVSDQDIAMFRAGKKKGASGALGVCYVASFVAACVGPFLPEPAQVIGALAIVVVALVFYSFSLPD